MDFVLKRLRKMADDELVAVSEAIDKELKRRLERLEEVPDSARRRALKRQQSYRQRTGAGAPPISIAGLGKKRKTRRAA